MRNLFSAKLAALSILAPAVMFGQLSITNYQLVSTAGTTQTYTAQVSNTGVALGSVTATANSLDPYAYRVEPEAGTLNFGPVSANGLATSTNSFTIIVSASGPVNWSYLQWSFQSTAAGAIANAGPNQTAGVGQTVTLDGSGSTNPSGVGTLSYQWAFVTRPPGSSTILTNQTGVHPTFFLDVAGTYVVQLTVSNGSSSSSATVTISTGDTAPVANAGPNQTALPGATITLNGSGSTDTNGDPLTYLWALTTIPTGSAATLSSTTAVKPTFIADLPGTYVATLVVNDGTLNSAPATVTISDNTPPVANAGPNQVVNVETTVHLDGSASTDADQKPLTYLWSLITRPANSAATLNSTTAVQPTFFADFPGTYVAQLIVSDGGVPSTPATVQIMTNPPLPPTANPGPPQVLPNFGVNVQLSGSGTDPQGYQLSYLWSFTTRPMNSTATLTGATTATPKFFADQPGTYIVQLIVNDGFLPSAPVTVTITTNTGSPTANPGSPLNVNVGTTVTLNGSASLDPNDEPLTYSWTFNSKPAGSTATLTGANTAAPTFVPDVAGLYVAQLIVSDGFASSTPVTVNVMASVVTTPTIILQNGIVVSAGGQATLSVSLSAPPVTSLFITLMSSSPNVTFTPSNGVVVIPAGKTGPVTLNVNGVNFGSATITANATGYTAGTTSVLVSDTIAFTPATNTITGEKMQQNFLFLSATAPAAGVTINLTSSNTSVATVPATVFIQDGTNNVNVPVTSVGGGTAVIHASNALLGIADTTLTVTAVALEVTTTQLNPGLKGVPYSQTLTATNGTTPYNWALISGALPTGMTFSSAGVLGGTPTAVTAQAGVPLTFHVTDSSVPAQSATVTLTLTVVVGTPNAITPNPGTSPQSTGDTTVFATPLAATVVDVNNFPVPNTTVIFTIVSGGGAGATFGGATTAQVQTNSSGVATAPPLTANGVLGSYTVTANVSPTPLQTAATFTLNNIVGPPTTMTVTSGTGQSAVEGTAFANPLVVTVKDGGGFVVSGAVVTFAAPASANGSFPAGNTATTTASGIATSNQFVAGGKAGAYVVTATSGAASTTFSLTNNVGAPATITTASGSPQSVAVNTAFALPLVATVKDSGGNVLTGVPVTFVAPTSGASVTFTTANPVNTDASGNATVSVKSNGTVSAAPYLVAANLSSSPLPSPATFQLNNLTGPPASIAVFSGSPQSAGITTAFALPLVAVVKDSGNNVVSGATVTFSVTTGTGIPSVTFTNGAAATTDVNGNATKTVTANNVTGGPYSVTATVTGVTAGATFSLTNLVGPPFAIAVSSGSGQNVGISTAFANPLVAKVTDVGGNVVPNATVTFSAPLSGASGTFAGATTTATAISNTSGLATSPAFSANSVSGGPYTVTATVTGVTAGANFSMTNLTGNPAQIVINGGNGQGAQIGKAYTSPLSVIVKDSGGNPIPNVGVTFQAPSSGPSVTFANGVTTATTVANTGIATSAAMTANATFGPVTVTAFVTGTPSISTSFGLNNNAGPPASIAVSAGSGQTVTVLTAFSQSLQAIVKDSGGNPVAGVSVTFTPSSAGSTTVATGSFAAVTSTTNTLGVATSTVLTANKISGNFTVTASVTGANPAVVTPVASPFQLTNIASAPASITATTGSGQTAPIGTAFALPLTATVKDANGNLVSGATVTFTAPTTGPSGTFASATTTATAVTGTNGQAVSPIFTANSSANANQYNVVASVNGVTANFALTNGPGVPANITITPRTNNQQVQIGTGVSYQPLQVTVTDLFTNPVAAGTVVTFTVVPGAGSAGATPSTMTAPTNASGVATATSGFAPNLFIGTFTVTATAGAAKPATFTLQNMPGKPNAILNNNGTATQSAQINQQFATPLSVTVTDQRGNPVATTVQVTFTAPGGTGASGTFGGALSTTVNVNSSGIASAVLTANSVVNPATSPYKVTAFVVGTPTLTTSFSMQNTVGPPASIVVTPSSNQSAVVNTKFTQAMAVTVTDAGNNPEPAGIVVTFTAPTGSGATGTFAAGPTTTATTNASGVATVAASTFTANTVAGTYNLTASAGSATPANIALTNTPGTAAFIVVKSGSGQSAQLTQAFAAPLVATVTDQYSNLVGPTSVVFSAPTSGASGTFGTGTSTTATVPTAAGIATSPAFTANKVMSATGTTYNVTASVAGVSPSATFALTNLAGTPNTITLTNQTQSVQVGQTVTLTATVKDIGGDPLQGVVVTFTAPGTGATGTFATGANPATTNASGVATISFTANHTASATAYNIGVSVPGNTAPAQNFSVTNTPGPATTVTATSGTPQTVQINTAFAPLVAVVTDQFGNPVLAGISVQFTTAVQTGPSGLFNGQVTATVPTIANGTVTVSTFKADAKVGQFNVTAGVPGGVTAATWAMTITPGPAAAILVTGGNNQTAAVTTAFATPFAVTVTDSGSNPISGAVVTFKAPSGGAGGTFAGLQTTTATTNSSGVATTTTAFTANTTASPSGTSYYVAVTSGSVSVACPPQVTGPCGVSLTNIAGAAATIIPWQYSSEAAQTNEQFTSPLQALVRDQYFNVVSGAKVVFTAPAQTVASATFAGGNNTAVTGTGSQTGIAVSNFISANGITGTYNITASIVGVTGTPATFSLINSTNQGSNGTFSMTPSSSSALSVGQNMEIVVNINVSSPILCSVNPLGLNINVTTDGVNLFVGRGSVAGTNTASVQIPCSTTQSPITQTQVYVQAASNLGTFPVTLEAPGYTTNNTINVTVTRGGFVLSSTASQPFGTSINTFQAQTTPPLTVYAVQLDGGYNFVGLGTVAGGQSVSIPVTVLDPTFGTMTTTPVTIAGGNSSATTSFTSSGKIGNTILSIAAPTGFSQPNANTSVAVSVATATIVPPTATVGLNLEAPVYLTLNGQAPGPCGGELSTPFTVTSQNPFLLFSNTATGQGLATINVPIQNCGSSSGQPFYVQVIGGAPGTALNYTVACGAGQSACTFPTATGTITAAASGFVISDAAGNPGSPSFFRTVANSGRPENLTVFAYELDGNKNPVAPQAIAPGSSINGIQVSVPVTVDNPQFGGVSPATVVISSGSSFGSTAFSATQGGAAQNPDIVNVGVTQPTSPAGFTKPAADTSIQGQITNPGINIQDGGTPTTPATVGQYLQSSGTISIGVPQSSPVTFTLLVTSGSILLSTTGLDSGFTSIPLTIPANATTSQPYSIYGLASSGSATYTVTAQSGSFNPASSTIDLVPSGAALVGNFAVGGSQELVTSVNLPIASGVYNGGITAVGTIGQTCIVNTFNGSGTGASATVALTGTNTIAAGTPLVFTNAGSGFSSAPTTAVAASGPLATCSGTASVTTTLATPSPFTVEVGQLTSGGVWVGQQALIPTASVVINLSEPTSLGTFSTNQVTMPGGQATQQVGFTPTIDGSGAVSITSVNGLTGSGVSNQSSMQVQVNN